MSDRNSEETKRVHISCISEMLEKLPSEFIIRVYRLTEYLYLHKKEV